MDHKRLMDTFFFSCMKALLVAIGVALVACATGLMAEGQQGSAARPGDSFTSSAQDLAQPASGTQPQGPQAAKADALPDAPEAHVDGIEESSTQARPYQNPLQKRILMILPNFRTVPSDVKLPPQTVKEKFVVASQDSFYYSTLVASAGAAGFHDMLDSYPEFGHGVSGYGQYFWRSGLDMVQENYMTEFVFPTLLHQDTRYYLLGHGGFWRRGIYAVSRTIITRNDAGNTVFNSSQVLGAGVASAISDFYYPSRVRTFGHTMQGFGINMGVDAVAFGAKEFGQDVERKWFHKDQ